MIERERKYKIVILSLGTLIIIKKNCDLELLFNIKKAARIPKPIADFAPATATVIIYKLNQLCHQCC